MARYETERGNTAAALDFLRSALARECYLAGLVGAASGRELEVVAALLPGWASSSTDELLVTARAILTEQGGVGER